MKTFRMIGMVLFAILMCVDFSACSSSNDDPTEGVGNANEKKLVEIKQAASWGDNFTCIFSYDNKGRLINFKSKLDSWGEFRDNQDYTWGNNVIINSSYTFSLNNGLIVSDKYDEYKYNSSNQLITFGNIGEEEYMFTWSNGNLVKMEDYAGRSTLFNYNNQTCKGFFPLIAPAIFYEIDCSTSYYRDFALFMVHPQMGGIQTKNLPNKIIEKNNDGSSETVYSMEYTFTNDGYIETCTITTDNNYHGTTIMIVTFKWQ